MHQGMLTCELWIWAAVLFETFVAITSNRGSMGSHGMEGIIQEPVLPAVFTLVF